MGMFEDGFAIGTDMIMREIDDASEDEIDWPVFITWCNGFLAGIKSTNEILPGNPMFNDGVIKGATATVTE